MATYSYLYGDKDQNTSSFNSGLYSSADGNSDKLQMWTATNPLAFSIALDSKLTTATTAQITIKVFDADERDLVNLRLTTQSGTTVLGTVSQGNNGSGEWTLVTFNVPTSDLKVGGNNFQLYSAATATQADKQFALDFAELTLTAPDNVAPQARNDSYQLNEDGSITGNVLANDSDANGDTLSATLATGPAHGTLVLNANGSFTYTPAANYNGPDSFTYTASDGKGGTATATVSLTVTPVNDAPVAVDDVGTTAEDKAVTFTAAQLLGNDSDVDSATLTITAVGNAQNGTVTLNADGSVTFTPNANYNGPASFEYTVSDGALTDTGAVSLTVTPVNDAPVVANPIADQSVAEDTAWSFTVPANSFSDVDGDTLTYSATLGDGSPLPGWLTFTAATRTFTGTPPQDWNGSLDVKVTASDGSLSASDTFKLTVTPVNDAPVANPATASGDEDGGAIAGQVTASDVDSTNLTYKLVAPVAGLTFNANGSYSYVPAKDFNGTVSFQYVAHDGELDSAPATVTLTINPVNDAPVAAAGTNAGNEDGGAITGQVAATDVEGDALTYSLVTGPKPEEGTLVLGTDGSYSFTPSKDFNGTVSFTYRAHDGSAYSEPATVTLTINPVNDAPVFDAAPAVETDEDTATTITVSASDVDGDTLSYTAGAASHGTVAEGADGTFTYTPDADFFGSDSFEVTVSDGNGGTAKQTISLTVNPVNDAPVAPATNMVSTDEDTTSTAVAIGATDVDSANLTYSLKAGSEPAKGTVFFDQAKGSFVYTPAADTNGTDSFTILVSDGQVTTEQVVSVTVNPVNDAPVATSGTASGDEDNVIHGQVPTATDVDGDALTYSLVAGPADLQGQLTFRSDGTYDFAPAPNFNGEVVFSYKANDGQADSNVETVTITVAPVNDAPVAQPGGDAQGDEDTMITGQVPAAIDVDSDVLSYRLVDEVAGLTFNEDGSYSYTPAANFNGTVTFDYYVTDGELQSAPQTVVITVDPVNDAPTGAATAILAAGTEDTDYTVSATSLLAGFTDVDGDSLAVTGLTADQGTVTDNGDGTFTIAPTADYNGPVTLSYTVTDGNGGSAAGTQTFTLAAVNDAPTAPATNSVTTDEDTTSTAVAIGAADIDSSSLSYAIKAGAEPQSGSVIFDQANGTFVYTPQANANGTDSFTILVSDGDGGSVEQVVSVVINPINDAPAVVASLPDVVVNEDAALDLGTAASFADVDAGDVLTYSAQLVDAGGALVNGGALPGWLSIDAATGKLSGTPLNGDVGDIRVKVTASDGEAAASSTFKLTVANTNDAPVAVDDSGEAGENQTKSFDVLANDTDDDVIHGDHKTLATNLGAISVTSANQVVNGIDAAAAFSVENGQIKFTPGTMFDALGVNETATVTVGYSVADDAGATDTGVLTLTVTGANDAPVAVADTGSAGENETRTFAVLANDTDIDAGDTKTLASLGTVTVNGVAATAAQAAAFTIAGNQVQFAPGSAFDTLAAGQKATVVVNYTMKDGAGATSSSALTLTVNGANDAATIGGTKLGAVTEDGVSTISHALTITDPDAGEAAFRTPTSLNGTYGSFTFNAGTGAWTYTLDNGRTATNSLVGGQKVSDTLTVMSHDGTATETITVGITGANDPLVVGRDQARDAFTGSTVVGEDETMLIKISDLIANDIDADFGEGATFVSAGPTSSKGASVYYSLAEGLVQYSADATTFDKITSNTTDTFTYVVKDAQGQLHTGYVDINIAPVADAGDINLTNNVDNSGSNRSTASKGETINALNANDIVYGLGGDDRIFGGNGDDRLYGGDNSDYLDGGRGDDFLAGERGNDQLYGGLGNDVFAFGSHTDALSGTKIGSGTDIIWDFKVGNDRLQLGGTGDNVTIVDKRAFVANIDGDATTGVNGMESGTVLTLGHGTDASGNLITSTVYLVGVSNQIDTNHLLVA